MGEEEVVSDVNYINRVLETWLTDVGLSAMWIHYMKAIIMFLLAIFFAYILQFIVRRVLVFILRKLAKVTSFAFFQHAIRNRLPHFLGLVVPYTFVRAVIPIIFEDFPKLISPALKITDLYMVFMVIWVIMALIRTVADIIQEREAFRNKSFKSYIQVIQIVLYILGAVVVFSILTGKSATTFFAAMGAASAVLMLMFKDTIMGFVSSIQLSSNDMLRIGDWITMSKYGADGTVEEINLTTVKIINFDKTITTIPTYAFISDSFQNWRGMQQSGGRRFTRSLFVNQSDIYFLSNEELDAMKKVESLKLYIEEKQKEIENINASFKGDLSNVLNGRSITNSDLFIQYATQYLLNHPKISKEMTLMVRTLAPTPEGLPIQLYTFTNTVIWTEYEGIVGEIVNHLISALRFFKLRIYTTTASDSYDIYIKENPVQVVSGEQKLIKE